MARIMLLETDRLLAKSLTRYLEKEGHSIDWQVDPQEAIISADVEPVELVVLDLVLAGRSGVEFLYEFRSYPDWAELPVIVYANVPEREVGTSLESLGQLNVITYLQKQTSSLAQLAEAIEKSLIRHEAHQH